MAPDRSRYITSFLFKVYLLRRVIRTHTSTTQKSGNTNYLLFPRTTSTAIMCSAGRWPVANGNLCSNDRGGAPEMLKVQWSLQYNRTIWYLQSVLHQLILCANVFKQKTQRDAAKALQFFILFFRLLPQLNKCCVSYSFCFEVGRYRVLSCMAPPGGPEVVLLYKKSDK